jgi:hypothetical protein
MRALSAAVLVVLVAAAASLDAQGRELTRDEIAAAIAFGEARAPQPYLLRHQGRPDNPVVVGVVYTPFLRVAFLARAAAAGGRHLQVEDVDALTSAPVVYIAFRWYGLGSYGNEDLARVLAAARPQVVMLPVAPHAPQYVAFTNDPRNGAVRPVWSSRGATVLESFGAAAPYDDIALVAVFPAAALEPGRPFAIFKDVGAPGEIGSERVIATGVVRADDVAAWR